VSGDDRAAGLRGATLGIALYFLCYEYLHYLMHFPGARWIERRGWFRFLHEHHRLHHRFMRRNFNLVLPLADLCLGTLIRAEGGRSRVVARGRGQAPDDVGPGRGPSVGHGRLP
jgi:hypothetical protein